MNYKEILKNGDRLSILGYGCMRFPKDDTELTKQLTLAIESGINYFDTAYIYPNSEERLGKFLAEGNYRQKVKIATKIPLYMVKKREDFDKLFNTQLKRLQTDYIDYYLFHMLTDTAIWERLVGLGVLEWIKEKKNSGKIRNIGFSYHGGKDEFKKIVDLYNWEMCLIQYNYMDENLQAGRSGLDYAAGKGIPVMIMEPLRGGALANKLPKNAVKIWENYIKEQRSAAEWAFRWLWDQPNVSVVLSGMNSVEVINENVRVASDVKENSLTDEEIQLYAKVKGILCEKIIVPCTGCGYCMPCPKNVDIPTCFSCYNTMANEGKFVAFKNYMMQTTMKKETTNASNCVKCGACEVHCPQGIKIREELKNVVKKLEGIKYKPVRSCVKWYMKLK